MKIKNIIIINDSNFISGGEDKVAIQSANIIVNTYNDVNVYFFSNNNINNSSLDKKVISVRNDMKIPLEDSNKIYGAIRGIYNTKNKKVLVKFLKRFNGDETIIHVHSWTKSITSCIFDVAEKLKIPLVLTLHDYFTACPNGGFYNYKQERICNLKPCSIKCIISNCDSRNYGFKIYRILRQYFYNRAVKKIKYAISISEFSENILRNYLPKDCKITRIYNPIDFDVNVKKSNPEKSDFFLYVGRVSKEKGVEIFCNAITKANAKGIVVGDGTCKKELEKRFDNIIFEGWKNSNDVKQIMKRARCLIIPSKWYEGAPLTPLEAMQYGIPCISSANNATIDYLKNDVGMIYKNESELISLIKKCGDNRIIENYSKKSFNYIETEWKNKNYASKLMELYCNILNES